MNKIDQEMNSLCRLYNIAEKFCDDNNIHTTEYVYKDSDLVEGKWYKILKKPNCHHPEDSYFLYAGEEKCGNIFYHHFVSLSENFYRSNNSHGWSMDDKYTLGFSTVSQKIIGELEKIIHKKLA